MSKKLIEPRVRQLYEVSGLTIGQIAHNLGASRKLVASLVIKHHMRAPIDGVFRGGWGKRHAALPRPVEDPNVPKRRASSVEEFIKQYGVTACPSRYAAPSPQSGT